MEPRLVGGAKTVVEAEGLTIREIIGNVATKTDDASLAICTTTKPAAEPWLTMQYDEYMHVTKGTVVLLYDGGKKSLEVPAGSTAFIPKQCRFKPEFPLPGTEYMPLCLPAFRPDRCAREDEAGLAVTTKLRELHDDTKDTLFHMCPLADWEAAQGKGEAYFPPTFEVDGFYTHATAVPARLIDTANHFYTASPGKWVVLVFSRSVLLKRHGIVTRDEGARPVGDTAVSGDWEKWVCPHVFGGIPAHGVVTRVLEMRRDAESGRFLSIEGVE